MTLDKKLLLFPALLLFPIFICAQKSSLSYTVRMDNPEWHFFQVQLSCKGIKKDFIDFKMPVWTPGYYQKLDYAKNLQKLKATDENGIELSLRPVIITFLWMWIPYPPVRSFPLQTPSIITTLEKPKHPVK